MDLNQVAAITSSVGRYCKEPKGIADSLKKIRDIGYRAVQISGIAPIDDKELVTICNDLGLTICGTHEKNLHCIEKPEVIIDRLKVLGCSIAGYPYPHTGGFASLDDVTTVVDGLNRAGEILHRAGIKLVYHNHDIEFVRFENMPVLEMIYGKTNPNYVQGEPDTFWIQAGGGDPVAWCKHLHNRLPVLHMKDFGTLGKRQIVIKPIGQGNLNWQQIISAAESAGCKWFVVEHDGGTFDDLAASFRFIHEHLVEK